MEVVRTSACEGERMYVSVHSCLALSESGQMSSRVRCVRQVW